MVTTFDGYPMAQQGKPSEALMQPSPPLSSAAGGGPSITFLAPGIASFVLRFGRRNSSRLPAQLLLVVGLGRDR